RRAKISASLFESESATKFVAGLANTAQRPSAEMSGSPGRSPKGESILPLDAPAASMLTSLVTPETKSRTKTSGPLLVSLFTRLLAADTKATNWPLEEIEGEKESALPPPMPFV